MKEKFYNYLNETYTGAEIRAIRIYLERNGKVTKVYSDVDKRKYKRTLKANENGFYVVLNGADIQLKPVIYTLENGEKRIYNWTRTA